MTHVAQTETFGKGGVIGMIQRQEDKVEERLGDC